MEILSLKDSIEKDTFFRKLPNLAEQLPRQIVLKKVCLVGILNFECHLGSFKLLKHFVSHNYDSFFVFSQLVPLLASALEFGSAAAPALTALLKMGSWLSAEEFSTKVSWYQANFFFYIFFHVHIFISLSPPSLSLFLYLSIFN